MSTKTASKAPKAAKKASAKTTTTKAPIDKQALLGNIAYYNRRANPVAELERVAAGVRNVHLKDNRGGFEDWYFPAVGEGGSVDFRRVREILDGPTTPRVDLWVGFHDAGHATALGKSVLASLDVETRTDYLARHALPDLTPHTITDPGRLLRELAADEADGVIMDYEEYSLGTACAAAPVSDGSAIGAVALSMPVNRIKALQQGGDTLRRTAARVSRALALSAV